MHPLLLRSLAISRKAMLKTQAIMMFAVLDGLRLLPAESAMNVIGAFARRIGPLLGRHRVALANLELAMPELSADDRAAIAGDMWENMARLVGEYVYLDEIFDYEPDRPDAGRVEVSGVNLFVALRETKRPRIFFTAHIGNFELLPIAAQTFGLEVTAMFRPPNNPYVAERVLAARTTSMGHLVPSKAGAAISLARILAEGGNVGVLVDQRFIHGQPTTFFGVKCETSPLVARLARQFDCDIHPTYCVRLPNGRYRLTLENAIEQPRGPDGTVDAAALTQMLNDKVESWVRAYPGQWTWFHKRWKPSPPKVRPSRGDKRSGEK
jgi:Kdo2-lipid IVA lauroyltransferase/acyltransferase